MFEIPESAFISESAVISGDVSMGEDCSVYFNASIRGDVGKISMGRRCNVQDNCVIHAETHLGDDVSIGHSAIVHGCRIGNRVLIGMGSIVMDGCVIGDDCIIGAGSLLTSNSIISPKSMVFGRPAKVVRSLKDEELGLLLENAEHYHQTALRYVSGEVEIYKP